MNITTAGVVTHFECIIKYLLIISGAVLEIMSDNYFILLINYIHYLVQSIFT